MPAKPLSCEACTQCWLDHALITCPRCKRSACRHHRAPEHPFTLTTPAVPYIDAANIRDEDMRSDADPGF